MGGLGAKADTALLSPILAKAVFSGFFIGRRDAKEFEGCSDDISIYR